MSESHLIEIENNTHLNRWPENMSYSHSNSYSAVGKQRLDSFEADMKDYRGANFTKKTLPDHLEIKSSKIEYINKCKKPSSKFLSSGNTKSMTVRLVRLHKAEGDRLYSEKMYNEAKTEFLKLISYIHYDPEFESQKLILKKHVYVKVLCVIGKCFMKLNDLNEAAAYFEQVLGIDKANIKAHYLLAHVLSKRNDVKMAFGVLTNGYLLIQNCPDAKFRKTYSELYDYVQNLYHLQQTNNEFTSDTEHPKYNGKRFLPARLMSRSITPSLFFQTASAQQIYCKANIDVLQTGTPDQGTSNRVLDAEKRETRGLNVSFGLMGSHISMLDFSFFCSN